MKCRICNRELTPAGSQDWNGKVTATMLHVEQNGDVWTGSLLWPYRGLSKSTLYRLRKQIEENCDGGGLEEELAKGE